MSAYVTTYKLRGRVSHSLALVGRQSRAGSLQLVLFTPGKNDWAEAAGSGRRQFDSVPVSVYPYFTPV